MSGLTSQPLDLLLQRQSLLLSASSMHCLCVCVCVCGGGGGGGGIGEVNVWTSGESKYNSRYLSTLAWLVFTAT